MLQAFFVTFVKQGRLWERQHARTEPDGATPDVISFAAAARRAA
jgi:hypothetical protein